MKVRTFSLHITAIMFVIAVMLAIASGHYAFAADNVIDSGTCGDEAVWTLTGTENDMVLTISGKGSIAPYSYDAFPWSYKCDKIKEIVVEEGIEYISDCAFRDCTSLTRVSLPNSLTSIEPLAFCDCSSLTNITIPGSVKSIGRGVFVRCSSLTSISIPGRVTTISTGLFDGCSSLTSVSIPNSVTTIGDHAFYHCTGLKSISIPDSVTSIEEEAFCGCSSLESIILPASVTSIGSSAFYDCNSLKYTFYGGDKRQWATIGFNTNPGIVHYSASWHTWDEDYTVDKPATCKEEGRRSKHCSVCDVIDETTIGVIPKADHKYDKWVVTKKATFTADGSKSKHCSVCDALEPGSEVTIPKVTSASLSYTSTTYNGTLRAPAVTVKSGDTALVKGTDYTVTYGAGRTNAGTYNVTVNLKGNYSGSKTLQFTIKPKAITPTVTLGYTACTYNGSVRAPAVTVKDGTKTLTNGTDYSVTYGTGRKNVGSYKITVKMKGNYSGSKVVYFRINPKGTTLLTPVAASKAITVKWNKQAAKMGLSTITGYQIQLATDTAFTKNLKQVGVAGYSKVSSKVTKLLGGKRYYIRIRTYKTVNGVTCYSAWSKYKYITTKK